MIVQSPYTLQVKPDTDTAELKKHTWLVILHASRIPPHVGIVIEGNYNSLTIKGHELDVNMDVLVKTIQQKRIETLFVKLVHHPVFSYDYQKETFQHFITQYKQVKPNEATCLSPVKLFLQEFYAIQLHKDELLFEMTERLKQNNYISYTLGMNVDTKLEGQIFSLPMYTHEELQVLIKTERAHYYTD